MTCFFNCNQGLYSLALPKATVPPLPELWVSEYSPLNMSSTVDDLFDLPYHITTHYALPYNTGKFVVLLVFLTNFFFFLKTVVLLLCFFFLTFAYLTLSLCYGLNLVYLVNVWFFFCCLKRKLRLSSFFFMGITLCILLHNLSKSVS